MKKIILSFLVLFGIQALAQQMPMAPLVGKFSFNGDSHITNKVRSIYIGEKTPHLNQLIQKYQADGYTCAVLENDDYACGRNEAVAKDDMIWVAKANVENQGLFLKFAVPSEPPVLEHDYHGATVWTVTQDVVTPEEHVIPEIQYSFSKALNGISYFDMATLTQNDFQIVSEKEIQKDVTYTLYENGTHLEVTVSCLLDRNSF
jgi:hypothetical protein